MLLRLSTSLTEIQSEMEFSQLKSQFSSFSFIFLFVFCCFQKLCHHDSVSSHTNTHYSTRNLILVYLCVLCEKLKTFCIIIMRYCNFSHCTGMFKQKKGFKKFLPNIENIFSQNYLTALHNTQTKSKSVKLNYF